MKILVTGSKGQLGNELRRLLATGQAEIGPVPAEYAGAEADYVDYDELDITDASAVGAWFGAHGPYDLVVNCAAATNVDGCEADECAAYNVNCVGPRNLARACTACGAKYVQVSTDYVFPGDEPGERVEPDPIAPISAYGRTKAAGEFAAVLCPRHFIVRTAWLYGYVGRNFVKTMRRLGASHGFVTVVDDQIGNPTSANDLAYEILRLALTEEYGTYHCTNEGTCSWADFAARIMEGSGLPCEVRRCTSVEYKAMNPASADRPRFSGLRNQHLADTVGNEMRPWQEAIDMYLQRLPELEG